MNSAIEQILSGISTNPGSGINGNWKKTKPGKNDNGSYRDESGKLMHQALAGRVQYAISCLPEIHRRFGMMMYAPINFVRVEDIEVPADWILNKVASYYLDRKKPLSNHKYELLPFLVRAMLTRHRSLVTQSKDPFYSTKALRDHLHDEFGVRIDAQDFTRNYGDLIKRVMSEVDRLDRICLVPASRVVTEFVAHSEILSDVDREHMWPIMGEMWDECFNEIKKYCGGL